MADIVNLPAISGISDSTNIRVALYINGQLVHAPLSSLSANVASINGGPLAGFRNKILNGRYLINQGNVAYATTLSANINWIDCWKAGPAGCTLTTASSVVTITAGALTQTILGEDMEPGTYCINWVGTAPCTVNGVAKAKGGTFTAGGNVVVSFGIGTVSAAQVEPGSTPTPFEGRPVGVEIAACRWRFEVVQVSTAFWDVVAGTISQVSVPFTRKRVTPSLTTLTNIARTGVAADSFVNINAFGATYSCTGSGTPGSTVISVLSVLVDARP